MLVGLTGNKGAGKDTVAQFLIEDQGFVRMAFADKLKEAVCNLLDISIEQVEAWKDDPSDPVFISVWSQYSGGHHYASMSWGKFLQRFGTEMGRNTFGGNFWVDLIEQEWISTGNQHVVITDVRFDNEAAWIINRGGYIIEVKRPGYEPDGHASEEPLPVDMIDSTIYNNGTLRDLRTTTKAVIHAPK